MVIGEAITIGLLLGASALAVVSAKMKFQSRIELGAEKSKEKEIAVPH